MSVCVYMSLYMYGYDVAFLLAHWNDSRGFIYFYVHLAKESNDTLATQNFIIFNIERQTHKIPPASEESGCDGE